MKVVGLITEYNPFHNGHLYHIQKAKEMTGADYVLVVMSGNFVQRGAPSMMPKHIRAEMALRAGASAVLELPVCFACGSAEYFAAGAVSLLDSLNCIGAVCFGSECGDIKPLKKIAAALSEEPDEYKSCLRKELKKGRSFPSARQTALKRCLGDNVPDTVLKDPNNILGIEYLKALRMRKSKMKAHTIKRIDSGYHNRNLNKTYSSASAIRGLFSCAGNSDCPEENPLSDNLLFSDIVPCLEHQIPSFCMSLMKDTYRNRYPVRTDDFSLILKYRLLTETCDSLMRYMDMTEELAGRIAGHTNDFLTFSQFCRLIKTKDLTYTRISRSFFHILLNITSADMHAYKENGFCQYARLLGFREDSTELLSCLKKNSEVPLITKLTRTTALTGTGRQMLSQDIFAANLYESIVTDKFKTPFRSEFQQQIVRLAAPDTLPSPLPADIS